MTAPTPRPGRIPDIDLDDRRWQDLVEQALALRATYAPQWTDRNASDVGVTLVELFAWLVEGLIFKLNRVPDKTYVALLELLGVTREPAVPARTLLTFTPRAATTVPAATQAQTPATEAAPAVTFETEAELAVVPFPAAAAVRIDRPPAGTATATPLGEQLIGTSTEPVVLDLAPGATAQLCLGFAAVPPASAAPPLDVYVERSSLEPLDAAFGVAWAYSTAAGTDPAQWPEARVGVGAATGLRRDGLVRLTPSGAAAWAAQKPADWGIAAAAGTTLPTAALHWIGLRVTNPAATPQNPGRALRLGLTHLRPDTVPASSTRTVVGERVATSTGRPFQTLALRNAPVHRVPGTDAPYGHLTVTVDGTPWTLVDDLEEGPKTQFLLDPVRAEITFGNHAAGEAGGHGLIPPERATITAGYRYVVTGTAANVPAGVVSAFATPVDKVVAVTNPVPARQGRDEEPVEEAKQRAPALLRVRDRAVTSEDYEALARAAAPGVATVRCLTPRANDDGTPWTFAGLLRAPGNVTVLVVPDAGVDVAVPTPSPTLVQDVRRALDRRADVTARLHVSGPLYLPVKATADLRVFKRAIEQGRIRDAEEARTALRNRIMQFFHPVGGGPDGRGWQVGESVFLADVYEAVRPDAAVGYLANLQVQALTPLYTPPDRPLALGTAGPLVRVVDYEIVCAAEPAIPTPTTE